MRHLPKSILTATLGYKLPATLWLESARETASTSHLGLETKVACNYRPPWISNPKVAGNFYPKVAVKIDIDKCRTSSNSLFLGENPLAQMRFCSGDQTAAF